ncbi:uncharacterized protein [Rutidosis leptorrhynchoides]|uniref:uncharacterized protein n=1 Tax=Rutidosis leptorrhynchoides TaxID=125765 RepID=UPI003A9A08FE
MVIKWWNLGTYSTYDISDILSDSAPTTSSRFGIKVWHALKWVVAYLIWRNQNDMVFKGKSWSFPGALNEIQIISFEWISSRAKGKHLDWFTWLSSPSTYLSSS